MLPARWWSPEAIWQPAGGVAVDAVDGLAHSLYMHELAPGMGRATLLGAAGSAVEMERRRLRRAICYHFLSSKNADGCRDDDVKAASARSEPGAGSTRYQIDDALEALAFLAPFAEGL